MIETKDGKLRYMLSTRLEKSYAEAVDRLLAHHGDLQFSKYLRGLIYADAVKCGISTADLDRPAWVSAESLAVRGSIEAKLEELTKQVATLAGKVAELAERPRTRSTTASPGLFYSVKEAAEILCISLTTLEQLIAQGDLHIRRIGKRRLVPGKELEKLSRRDVTIVWPEKRGHHGT
jgi:excisionase family DNA binding protein